MAYKFRPMGGRVGPATPEMAYSPAVSFMMPINFVYQISNEILIIIMCVFTFN